MNKKKNNVKIIFKNDDLDKYSPMSWRFESIDEKNVEIMLSRDIDTRILEREVIATKEWIKSGKTFHIMRDHPYHVGWPIFAGLFSTRKIKSLENLCILCLHSNKYVFCLFFKIFNIFLEY